jgi:hypothetical protein
MITLNTHAGEWPDTDDQARVIVDSVLGNVPCVPCPTCRPVKTLVGGPERPYFSGN